MENEDDSKKNKNNVDFLNIGSQFKWSTASWESQKTITNNSESSESDIDDIKEENVVKKKKLSKTEREKTTEKLIFETEIALADNKHQPRTIDEFDALVLASPDSSIIWLQYMAFHLQNLQIDHARSVANRALGIIGFRNEQERLNVWAGLLNLENLYGTESSLEKVFKEALKNCDEKKTYELLVEIYTKSSKFEEAEGLFKIITKQFNTDPNIWLKYITFLMEQSKFDEAGETFKRSLSRLPKPQHINITLKMAQLEFKCGDSERGLTMMENLVNNNPKRTDLWSVYADLMVKSGDIDKARQILDRSISIKGSARQMKFLFTKYLEFEKRFGTKNLIDGVKEKARSYVESHSKGNLSL